MPADPNCPDCQGTGWKTVDRDGLSAAERCHCVTSASAEESQLIDGIPTRFAGVSFDTFDPGRPGGDPNERDRLSSVLSVVRKFAEESYPFDSKKGLLLQGPPGVGKTHLAVSALKTLAQRGFASTFFDYQTLLQRIRDGYNPAAGSSDRAAYRSALEADILLVDDLGAHRATDWVFDTVTSIISHRYNENKAILATTNLPIRELEDPVAQVNELSKQASARDSLADRIGASAVSRLCEMCRRVRIEAHDRRLTR